MLCRLPSVCILDLDESGSPHSWDIHGMPAGLPAHYPATRTRVLGLRPGCPSALGGAAPAPCRYQSLPHDGRPPGWESNPLDHRMDGGWTSLAQRFRRCPQGWRKTTLDFAESKTQSQALARGWGVREDDLQSRVALRRLSNQKKQRLNLSRS